MTRRLRIARALVGMAALLMAMGAAWLFAAPAARAGDRRLEILLVDMSAPATPASRACVESVARRVREDYATLSRLAAPRVRARVGVRGARSFVEWTHADLAPVIARGDDRFDAVALLDCRPEASAADVLVTSPAGGPTRLALRGVRLDRAGARWLAETILDQAWVGFSP